MSAANFSEVQAVTLHSYSGLSIVPIGPSHEAGGLHQAEGKCQKQLEGSGSNCLSHFHTVSNAQVNN